MHTVSGSNAGSGSRGAISRKRAAYRVFHKHKFYFIFKIKLLGLPHTACSDVRLRQFRSLIDIYSPLPGPMEVFTVGGGILAVFTGMIRF